MKILAAMAISLLTIGLFYILKDPACENTGTGMGYFNKWFVILSLSLSLLIKFATSISIEEK